MYKHEHTEHVARLTDNKHGMTFPLSEYAEAFIDFAIQSQGRALDIGAAYGVATLPVLEGGVEVIANDISDTELAVLQRRVPESQRGRLTLSLGSFPDEIEFDEASLDAVEASHVLHFLDAPALERGCQKLYRWLKPGGKVFVVCFTPYHQFMKKFIPIYEQRVRCGDAWPGVVEDSTPYVLRQGLLPKHVHLLDARVLRRVFEQAGFVVEKAELFACPEDLQPREFFHLDGREWVGLIAAKAR